MNIFRMFGDLAHLASILILIHKIHTSRSARGISFKTQILYAVVFITRYLDLFSHRSLYHFVMKTFFISSSLYIVYLMKVKFRPTHDPAIDTIRLEYLMGPCLLLALIWHFRDGNFFVEVCWAFSIYLESVAILPQLFMLQRTGEAETITTHYIFALGAYRALYIPNWMYRYFSDGFVDPISICAGIVQTGLYADFFWVYFNKVMKGEKFTLPA
ncbi:unnamed protein product [Parajaminaea phylloscopi]